MELADENSLASQNPYYVAQQMIMLGRTDTLISQFANQLSGIEEQMSPE
jgi:nuclear pore complex protein Nup107